ncbi:hypothetical protein J4457_02065 [Candidatus Woesearchaeota archaeon]|nr:hypothetical protein [Candidatus Woesearchaeota archaeon]
MEKKDLDVEPVHRAPFRKEAMDALVPKKEKLEKEEGKGDSESQNTQNIEESDSEKEDPGQKRIILWVILIIVIIFGLFVITKYFLPEKEYPQVTYNNFRFVKIDLIWYTQWVKGNTTYNLPFRYNPYEVENVSVTGDLDARFNQREIYITHDPADANLSFVALSATSLSQSLAKAFNLKPVGACARNETVGCIDRPIVTCQTENISVIYLKQDPETKVVLNGNCMTIQGQDYELLRATDRILFEWYRILKI